ncbi:hypothetical protein MO867_21985 [Microbulbifer sp. OS29]|uniref:Uncharacterized protein n=1 Tax=Microbulbifer okhotskensis TaxID=2926617 RepID=A0A9X2ERC8_9GAMM|nr:hypothetical protein [Microbulbifer okhotskensis]MCO1336997.1 hypothetical protein [Microbulbifer okhotskensis]
MAAHTKLNFESEYLVHGMKYLDSEKHAYSLTFYTDRNGIVEWIVVDSIHAILDARSVMTLFLSLDRFVRSKGERIDFHSLPLLNSIVSRLDAAGFFGEGKFEYKNMGSFYWLTEKDVAPSERRACATSYLMPLRNIQLLVQLAKNIR